MTYRETLKKARELDINPFDLIVAEELENVLDTLELDFTDKQFENACEVIQQAYFKADDNVSIWNLARAYCDLKEDGQPTTPNRVLNLAYGY